MTWHIFGGNFSSFVCIFAPVCTPLHSWLHHFSIQLLQTYTPDWKHNCPGQTNTSIKSFAFSSESGIKPAWRESPSFRSHQTRRTQCNDFMSESTNYVVKFVHQYTVGLHEWEDGNRNYVFFSCPEQLNRWPCHWLTESLTHSTLPIDIQKVT